MSSPPASPQPSSAMHSQAPRGPREPTNFKPRAPIAITTSAEHTTPAAELKKTFSKLISKGTALTGTKKGNRPDLGDLDERIARYKAKKEREKAEKLNDKVNASRKVDLGPALGQFDTPNVRERIRKWQATGAGVVSGDPLIILPPPIIPFQSPAGSVAGSDCGRSDYSNVGCGVGRLRGSPDMSPSRPAKEIMKEWETNSESGAGLGSFLKRAIEEERKAMGLPKEVDETEDEEKMLERQRGRDREAQRLARERERKLRRRSRGPANSQGALSGVEDEDYTRIKRKATKRRKNAEDAISVEIPKQETDGIRVRGDDDGIRVKPRRKKSKRREKAKDGGSDGNGLERQTVRSEGDVPLKFSSSIPNIAPSGDSVVLFGQEQAQDEDVVVDKREAYERELKAERDRRAERRKTFSAQSRPTFGHSPSPSVSSPPPAPKPPPHVAAVFPSPDAPPPPPAHTSLMSLRQPEPEEEIELMQSEPLVIPMSPSPPPIPKAQVPFKPPSPPTEKDFAPARFEDPGIRIYPTRKGSRARRRRGSGEHRSMREKDKGKERLNELSEEEITTREEDPADYEGSGDAQKKNRRRRRRRRQSRSGSSGSSNVSSVEAGVPQAILDHSGGKKPSLGARRDLVEPSPVDFPTRLRESPKTPISVLTTHSNTFPRVHLKPTPTKARATVSSPPPPKVALRPVPPKSTPFPSTPPAKVVLPKSTPISSTPPPRTVLPKPFTAPTSTPKTAPKTAPASAPTTPAAKFSLPKPTTVTSTPLSKAAVPGLLSTPGRVALPGLTSLPPPAPIAAPVAPPIAVQPEPSSVPPTAFNTTAPPPPPPPPPLPAWLAQFEVPPSPISPTSPKGKVLPGGLIENPKVPGTFLAYRRNPPPPGSKKESITPAAQEIENSNVETVAPLNFSKGNARKPTSLGEAPLAAPKKVSTPLGSPAPGKADFANVIEEIRIKIKEKEEKKKAARQERLGRKHSVLRSAVHVTRTPSIRNVVRAPTIRNVGRAPSIRNSGYVGRTPSRKKSVARAPSKSVKLPKVQEHIREKQPPAGPSKQTSEEFNSVLDGYESDILETMKTMTSELGDSHDADDLPPLLPPPAPLRISRPSSPLRSEVLPSPKRKSSVKPRRRFENLPQDSNESELTEKEVSKLGKIPKQSTDKQAADEAQMTQEKSVEEEQAEEQRTNERKVDEVGDDVVAESKSEVALHEKVEEGCVEQATGRPAPVGEPARTTAESFALAPAEPVSTSVEKPKPDILQQMANETEGRERERDKKKKKHGKKKESSNSRLNDPPRSSNTSLTESYLTRSTPRSSTTTLARDVSAPTPPPPPFTIPSPNVTPPRGNNSQHYGTMPAQKDKRDRPPKLSEMTSAFFKALKQEFQGVSVKAGQESSDSETDEHGVSLRQKQAALERAMEEERQRELAMEAELERKREIQWEREMEKERERQKAIELEIELEKEKEKQAVQEKELEEHRKNVQEEEEKWRIEVQRERERQREIEQEIEKEREKEKIRLAELERERESAKQRRQEFEKEKEKRKQLELEKEKQRKADEEHRQLRERQLAEERAKQEDQRRRSVVSPLSSAGIASPPPQKQTRNGLSVTSSTASSSNREFTPTPSVTTARTSPPPSRRSSGSSKAHSITKELTYSQTSHAPTKKLGPSPLQMHELATPMIMVNSSAYEIPHQVDSGHGLTRKYTSHADLISMLSVSRRHKSHHTSARTHSNATTATALNIPELMEEFIDAERRYMRELKTLVDDVIPVLLSTVLERADNQVAARQFGAGALSGKLVNPTRPIVDMGIALERIKRLHEGIPKHDADRLLKWAHDGKGIYEEYLKAWRMGFQDVIVTMAPVEEEYNLESSGWDAESRRQLQSRLGSFAENPKEGDSSWELPAVPDFKDDEEEKVDVAFLLKRPLVRLRILAKVLKRIDYIRHSPLAESCALTYQTLVNMARKKVSDEKARIEDEAASSIDASKAFDIHTFAPMPNITLNPSRKVRARDCFIMHMPHSSGQIMQRNVEFILRDEGAKERGAPRDSEVLICEVPVIGRLEKWLLFQPIPMKSLSARTGDDIGEIVVMVRGRRGNNPEWREVMVLKTTNDMAAFEWVQMLGLLPVPPADPFENFRAPPEEVPVGVSSGSSGIQSRSSTPETVKGNTSPKSHASTRSRTSERSKNSDSRSSVQSGGHRSQSGKSLTEESIHNSRKSSAGSRARSLTPPSRQNTITPVKSKSRSRDSSISTEGRSTPKPRPLSMQENLTRKNDDEESEGQHSRTVSMSSIASTVSTLRRSAAVGRAAGQKRRAKSVSSLASVSTQGRAESPVEAAPVEAPPVEAPPVVELSRHSSRTSSKSSAKSDRERVLRRQSKKSELLSGISEENQPTSPSVKPSNAKSSPMPTPTMGNVPVLSPTQKSVPVPPPEKASPPTETPPPPPPHRVLTPSAENQKSKKSLAPPVTATEKLGRTKRRTSSPLKHEYEPSTASEEDEDDETETEGGGEEKEEEFYSDEEADRAHSDVESDYESRSGSETDSETESETETESESESELGDSFSERGDTQDDLSHYPQPTLEIDQSRRRIVKKPITPIPEESEVSTTLPKQRKTSSQPSETSAVNAPAPVFKALAHIFSWSANAWQKFHPDECRIVVTSGRIEAFPNLAMLAGSAPLPGSGARDSPNSPNQTPTEELSEEAKALVMAPDAAPAVLSLELAPSTPIRRGTAVDLSIRTSPSSQFCGNSVMFRCRSPSECEALYNAINSARVSNASYHPLPNVQNKYHSYLDPDGAPINLQPPVKRGWGVWGRSGYRANSSKAPSIISSEGSVGSFSSAFSVLKRFGFGKGSSGGSSLGSLASEASAASSLPGLISGLPGVPGGPISMSGLKIRLYKRESASKWRDLGPARLSILKPPVSEGSNKAPAEEKRIVVRDKSGKVIMLDETLGEQCFERVARTGIAVSILVGELGPDGQRKVSDVGGLGSKNTVYMLQMKSEAETVYTFSIVGKHRY